MNFVYILHPMKIFIIHNKFLNFNYKITLTVTIIMTSD